MSAANGTKFPRLNAYLAGLPAGLASYPECQARTSLLSQFLEGMPAPAPSPEGVPEPLASVLRRRPRGLWMPEVHVMAVSLTIADHAGMDDDAYLRWLEELNRSYFRSLVLRVLFAFVSPAELVPRSPARWAAVHQGSTLTTESVSPNEARIILDFPSGLFAPVLLRHFTAVFQAALAHSNARDPVVTLEEASEVRGLYRARWD